MSQFGARILAGELPGDGTTRSIALDLQSIDAPSQGSQTISATGQAAALENANLDFSHIQPTAMFGRVVKLDSAQDAPRFCWWKGFINGRRRMRIQVVLNDPKIFCVRIHPINQPADLLGVIKLGAPLRHFDMTPARQRLDHEEEIRRPQPLVFVIDALRLPWFCWERGAYIGVQRDQFLIEIDNRIERIILLFMQIQHIFHRCDKLSPYLWDTPLLVLPRLEAIFFRRLRIVSGEIDSTNPNSTALPANSRSVQWS